MSQGQVPPSISNNQSPTPAPTSRTIIGPLTTTFTPPAECTTIGAFRSGRGVASFYRSAGCSNSALIDATTCLPPASSPLPSSVLNTDANLNGLGIYSPGLACPAGYVTACKQQMDARGSDVPPQDASSTKFQFPLIPNETAVGCCPSGFQCGSNQSKAQSCISAATSTVLTAATCGTNAYSSQFPFTFPFTAAANAPSGRSTTISVVETATVYAPLVQLAYQSTDVPHATTRSSSSTSSNNSRKKKSKISGGAIAGAAIGGVVGLIVIVAALIFFLQCWRKRKQGGYDGEAEDLPAYGSRGGGYAAEKRADPTTMAGMDLRNISGELDGGEARHEAPANEVKSELPVEGMEVRHELPAERI